MSNDAEAPLIVDCLEDLPEVASGWVFVRESGEMFVAREGEWIVYVKPPPPNLWSLLDDDS
jgi:hypothetical protein